MIGGIALGSASNSFFFFISFPISGNDNSDYKARDNERMNIHIYKIDGRRTKAMVLPQWPRYMKA